MPIVRLQKYTTGTADTGGTSITTVVPATGTPASNFLIVLAYGQAAATDCTCTITDYSGANTWTTDVTAAGLVVGSKIFIGSSRITTGLTSGVTNVITATFSASITDRRIQVIEYSGLAILGWFDQTANNNLTGTALDSGNITSTFSHELLIGAMSFANGGGAFTAGTNYTLVDTYEGTGRHVSAEERIVTATGTYSASGSIAVSAAWRAAIGTYRGAPSNLATQGAG